MTEAQATNLGFTPNSRSRELERYYTTPHGYKAVYIDLDFLRKEEIEAAKMETEISPHMNRPNDFKIYAGYYDPVTNKVSVPAGHNGGFYTTCTGNCAGWSSQRDGVLINATRSAAQVHFPDLLDFVKKNKIKYQYLDTGAPNDMFPWETRNEYLMRKHEVKDIELVEARKARERGDYQLAKKITMSL